MTFSFTLPLSLSTEIRHRIQYSVNSGQELLESFLTQESQFSSRQKQILIKHEFSRQIFEKKIQISNFITIAFRNFANALKNVYIPDYLLSDLPSMQKLSDSCGAPTKTSQITYPSVLT
jgi:hypothetical protein